MARSLYWQYRGRLGEMTVQAAVEVVLEEMAAVDQARPLHPQTPREWEAGLFVATRSSYWTHRLTVELGFAECDYHEACRRG